MPTLADSGFRGYKDLVMKPGDRNDSDEFNLLSFHLVLDLILRQTRLQTKYCHTKNV